MKKNRHAKILEIITERNVETQEELARLLREEGYEVTQATVSRDIRQLGLTKAAAEDGTLRYTLVRRRDDYAEDKYVRVLRDAFVSAEPAGSILVIKTVSGMAMAAAAALDAMDLPELAGCIAGDDTIFAAVRSFEDAETLRRHLRAMMDR